MLNPEAVDYHQGEVRITFTDEEVKPAVIVYLSQEDAWRLHQMIQNKLNMLNKKEREASDRRRDPTF